MWRWEELRAKGAGFVPGCVLEKVGFRRACVEIASKKFKKTNTKVSVVPLPQAPGLFLKEEWEELTGEWAGLVKEWKRVLEQWAGI